MRIEKKISVKTFLVNNFLKYQFTICVEKTLPISHFVSLTLLTCIFESLYYIILYWISIFYILITFYLSNKFPKTFGVRYINFLKQHSSSDVFDKYCGNPFSVLKAAIQNPEFIKVSVKNGIGKAIIVTGSALIAEHCVHKAKLGQVYEYQLEKYLNNRKHPSNTPFVFKSNSPSIIDKCVNRKDN